MFRRLKNLWKISNYSPLEEGEMMSKDKYYTKYFGRDKKAIIVEPDPVEELGNIIKEENV